ncbi:MAG: hypothetical protein WBI27_03020 [Thermoanaerobaculia bacterium]
MKVFNQRWVGILGLALLLAPSLPGVAAAQADNQKETADEDESAEAGSDISDEDRATMALDSTATTFCLSSRARRTNRRVTRSSTSAKAVSFRNWKVHFAMQTGNIATSTREVTGWPAIVNLRADPYEEMMFEAEMGYLRWYADNMWIFVPIQTVIKEFLATILDYPFQEGSSLNAAGINYGTLKQMKAMERLQEIETLARPNN